MECNYEIGQRRAVIFYPDDEKNCCIVWTMEQFFEEVGQICCAYLSQYVWLYEKEQADWPILKLYLV
jgi:hypothetical protein